MSFESAFLDRVLKAMDPLLPSLMVAGFLMAFTMAIRLLFRGQILAHRVRRPQALLWVCMVLFAAAIATNMYWPKLSQVTHLICLLVLALAVILAFGVAVFDLFLTRYRKLKLPSILKDIVVLVLYVVVVVMILSQSGVDVTSLVTTSAVLTAIIGFALQDLLSNLISGLSIQIEVPFQAGDWVSFENSEGEVMEVNWRATKIRTLDNDIVIIPNNVATRAPITNFSIPSRKQRRKFVVGLRYEVPPSTAHAALLAAAGTVDGILSDPPPVAQTRSFDDFAIQYHLRYYIDNFAKREQINSELATRVWYRLKRDGLTVPFPIRDVHLTTVDPEASHRLYEQRQKETEAMIAAVAVFAPLSPADITLLAQHSVTQLYTKGETIIAEGEAGSSFFIIAKGEVEVGVDWGTRRFETVGTLEAGDYFGERSLMTGENRSATVRTTTDSSLVVIEKETFAKVLRGNPSLVESIGIILSEREAATNSRAPAAPESDADRRNRPSLANKIRKFFQL